MRLSAVDYLKSIFKDNQAAHQAMIAEQRETNRLLRKLAGEGSTDGRHRPGDRSY